MHAAARAITMIASRFTLYVGDTVFVRRAGTAAVADCVRFAAAANR
jgi:hypothetical protein